MTTRIHSELRKLALAYYRGWVAQDRYLEIRKKYLQSISNDETPEAIDPKKIAPPKRKPSPGASSRARSSKNKWIILIALTTVLLLIVVGIYLATTSSPPESAITSTNTTEKVIPAPEKSQPEPLTDEQRFNSYLTENFLSQRSWDVGALNGLKLKWLGLSQEQQITVNNTKVFRDFSGALIERIVDERNLNNIVPSDYELALMTAAKNMGLISSIPNP